MATKYLFSNNATTTLAQSVSATATVITVASGEGALFPDPDVDESFAVTLVDAATGLQNEICYCTARSGDELTVVRGQEGKTATTWSAGDTVANYITADVMENWLQESDLTGYATQAWVLGLGYATQAWVASLGYATQAWVLALGYATQAWVTARGYATVSQVMPSQAVFGQSSQVYYTPVPNASSSTTHIVTLPFTAPYDGLVYASGSFNVSNIQPSQCQGVILIEGSSYQPSSGASVWSDTTLFPMSGSGLMRVKKGDNITVLASYNLPPSSSTFAAVGQTITYTFTPVGY